MHAGSVHAVLTLVKSASEAKCHASVTPLADLYRIFTAEASFARS